MSLVSPDNEIFVTTKPVATISVVIDAPTINIVVAGSVGPQGAKGEPGPPGGSTSVLSYSLHNNIAPPTAKGQIRLNNTNQTAATLLWLDNTSDAGADLSVALTLIHTGSDIYIQDKNDATAFQSYNVLAEPVNKGNYKEISIAWDQGGNIVPKNQELMVGIIHKGQPGPQGPPGQWTQLTQAQYDALSPPDPSILYVIIA